MLPSMAWHNQNVIGPRTYTCGYCDVVVGPNSGFFSDTGRIYICSNCEKPSYFDGTGQYPGVAFGEKISDVPEEIDELYNEARTAHPSRRTPPPF